MTVRSINVRTREGYAKIPVKVRANYAKQFRSAFRLLDDLNVASAPGIISPIRSYLSPNADKEVRALGKSMMEFIGMLSLSLDTLPYPNRLTVKHDKLVARGPGMVQAYFNNREREKFLGKVEYCPRIQLDAGGFLMVSRVPMSLRRLYPDKNNGCFALLVAGDTEYGARPH